MSNAAGAAHVAQQSRRDKLRFVHHPSAAAAALHHNHVPAMLGFPGGDHQHQQLHTIADAVYADSIDHHQYPLHLHSSVTAATSGQLYPNMLLHYSPMLTGSGVEYSQSSLLHAAAPAVSEDLWAAAAPTGYLYGADHHPHGNAVPLSTAPVISSSTFGPGESLSLTLSSNNQDLGEPPPAAPPADDDSSPLVLSSSAGGCEADQHQYIYAGSLQSVVSSSCKTKRYAASKAAAASMAAPFGTFTGYAAMVNSSRFFKPAQRLLDEFCHAAVGSRMGAVALADELQGEDVIIMQREDHMIMSSAGMLNDDMADGSPGGYAGGAPSAARSGGSTGNNYSSSVMQQEVEQKRMKLLNMQKEAYKRYKQYQQQVQMVLSSFDSIPGLCSAAPYASMTLKVVAKQFRRIRSVISSQLQQISKHLDADNPARIPSSVPSSSSDGGKISVSMSRSIRSEDQRSHSQSVWRPQRGLPERAVVVLRAWLFEHFLHPYPSDSDKHMLATQTGLSRNQVSNWFINARVRLWKPMVEEIHTLETRGSNVAEPSSRVPATESDPACGNMVLRQFPSDQMLVDEGNLHQLACVSTNQSDALRDKGTQCLHSWHAEKRSRMVEYAAGSVTELNVSDQMSFGSSYADSVLPDSVFGPVSLTLGLRHDGAYHYQQQPQAQQYISQFGGQVLHHDLVG